MLVEQVIDLSNDIFSEAPYLIAISNITYMELRENRKYPLRLTPRWRHPNKRAFSYSSFSEKNMKKRIYSTT